MSHWKHTITGIDFSDYPLWYRESIFQHICKENGVDFEQPPYCIAWEDPDNLDAPMKVTTPSPVWWAMALHGGILPPVEVYHALAEDEVKPDFARHTRGHYLHQTQPMPPMTPEQAMTYLVQKDIPPRVWRDYRGNRTIMRIVPRDVIPTDRSNRNAWRLNQLEDAA